jgi:hypothetical protein
MGSAYPEFKIMTDDTCNVILPAGYSSIEQYLSAHQASLDALNHKAAKWACSDPLGGHKPKYRNSFRNKPERPTRVARPKAHPVAVHTVAAAFEQLGRARGVSDASMATWIEAACRVAIRYVGKLEATTS